MTEKEDCVEIKGRPLGLKTENELPVPLKSIKVDVHIIGYVAEVSSCLTYFNEEKDPVEAVFTFPVDDGSAVFQFEADIDGRHIVAEIQEKEQAVLTYKDAVDHGKTAMLLKEDNSSGDIFNCMLGNLPPETEASLVMKYVIELPQELDGRLRFTLPTILNPRYSPDAVSSVAAEQATYVPPSKVPYEFSMTATVQGYQSVSSVTSDKIKLYTEFQDSNKIAKVTLGEDFKFDHDLCLLVQYEEPFTPQVVLEDGNPEAEGLLKEEILMVSFHPDLKEVAMATNGEYIFVIDRSGSMSGENMDNAKEALLLFLKSLPADCYFNIISFGSKFSSLFSSGSQKYSEESLKMATTLQGKMAADFGGTEILKPLKHVFKKKLITGHPRRVFVLTDGQVSNTNEVIGLVKKCTEKTDSRVFSLGIGSGASTALIKGLANNGRGKAEFICEGDRVQPVVISLLKCAMQPAIMNIAISWELPPDVTPVSIPTEPPKLVSAGERLTLFAILKGVDKHTIYAPSRVTLKGIRESKPVSYRMNFTLCEADDISTSAPVHRLATKAQIKLLQDEESSIYLQDDYSFCSETSKIQGNRRKVIDLSRNGNIISKYTAFVAIDTEGKTVERKSTERPCPVPTLSDDFQKGMEDINMRGCSLEGCGLLDSGLAFGILEDSVDEMDSAMPSSRVMRLEACSLDVGNYALAPATARKKRGGGLFGCGPSLSKMFSKKSKKLKGSRPTSAPADAVDAIDSADVALLEDDTDRTAVKNEKSERTDSDMMSVLALQQLHGQWSVSDQLMQLLCIKKEDFEKLDFSKESDVVCTVVVIGWLRKKFPHRKEEWQMIETKALNWLSSHGLDKPADDVIKQEIQVLWPE